MSNFRDQWDKWSLPSKLTAIGTLVGCISLVIAIIAYTYPVNKPDSIDSNSDIERNIYSGREMVYVYKSGDNFNNYNNNKVLSNNKNTLTKEFYDYAKSKYFNDKFNLGDDISNANDSPFYLKIFIYSHDLDHIKNIDEDNKITYSLELANNYALEGGPKERISLIESGMPVRLLEDMVVILENPEDLRNGYNRVEICKGLHVIRLSGFYTFSNTGSYQGYQTYYGYITQVDPEKAVRTVNHYNDIDCNDF